MESCSYPSGLKSSRLYHKGLPQRCKAVALEKTAFVHVPGGAKVHCMETKVQIGSTKATRRAVLQPSTLCCCSAYCSGLKRETMRFQIAVEKTVSLSSEIFFSPQRAGVMCQAAYLDLVVSNQKLMINFWSCPSKLFSVQFPRSNRSSCTFHASSFSDSNVKPLPPKPED